jgi:regulatory protein
MTDPHALSRAIAERAAARGEGRPVGDTGKRTGRPRRGGRRAQESFKAPRSSAPQEPPPGDRDLGPEPDQEAVARKILLDQLTGRARSRAELAKKLAQREVPEEIATRLLDRFEEVGLIDDEAFARDWIAQRQSGKGLARRALAQELRRKGIDDETATAALAEHAEDDPEAELEAARMLVRRKLRSVQGLEQDKAVRRLVGMLARKGHSSGVAYRVVREELADIDLVDPEHTGP